MVLEQGNIIKIVEHVENHVRSFWHKAVGIVLFVSFLFLSLNQAIMINNLLLTDNIQIMGVLTYCFVWGGLEYLIFRLIFSIYSKILKSSVYAMCIPYVIFKDSFYTFTIIKNVVIGAVYLALFSAPYIMIYVPVLSLVLDLLAVPVLFGINKEKFVPDIVSHLVFKAYAVPYFIYLLLDVVAIILGVA